MILRPRYRVALALVAAHLAGCSLLLGLDDPAGAATDGGSDGATADALVAPADAESLATCSNGALVATVTVDTSSADDSYQPSCGSGAGNDVALEFVAPATDYYVFSTAGSSFDTVLSLRDRCAGDELACSNDVGTSAQSELIRKVEQHGSLLVVVDGRSGSRGTATIAATPVTCPNLDVEGQSFPSTFTTAGSGNDVAMACGASDGEDAAFHWVAPSDGLYAFRATSSAFAPVVAVHSGPRCSDATLGCNVAVSQRAEVVRRVAAGDVLSVVVDSAVNAGAFDLEIVRREGECPEGGELVAQVGIENHVTALPSGRTLAPSCGPIEVFDRGGNPHELADMTYSLVTPTAPNAFAVSCSVQAQSDAAFVLYALQGATCSGPENAGGCRQSQPIDTDPDRHEAFLSLRGDKDTPIPYTVVVSARSITPVPVTITTICFQIATATDSGDTAASR